MTKRLSAGVLLAACAVLFTAMSAFAERPPIREWRGGEDPYSSKLPLFFRSSVGTTWVNVGQTCAANDTLDSGHSTAQVWCFDKASGDSTWPARGTQGSGNWNHWSLYAPPIPPGSKWHISTRHPNASARSAWCGCDSLGTNPACNDLAFWAFKEGYGDNWNYSLVLTMDGFDASGGGTVKFDIRYDSECDYDYTYLEYFNTTTLAWQQVMDGAATPRAARFNTVSGNTCTGHGGTGRCCGDDYYFHSDQQVVAASAEVPWHGNSTWMSNVTFPMPAQAGGMRFRWRCFSDGAWSDADGSGDTDGIAAIDNVLVTFTAPNPDVTVSDNFELPGTPFDPPTDNHPNPVVNASWTPGGLEGETFDGWHMEFDPKYKNKGNTCDFSNDWMWSSRPAAGFPTNGWHYYLVSPKIKTDGWTGGVMEYANYLCARTELEDFTNTEIRVYNATVGQWSLWNDFDGYIIYGGCEFWNMNETELLTPFLGTEVDSIQLAFEQLDVGEAGDFYWGLHGNVIFLVDNVSVGHFDGSASVFTSRGIDIFGDTFSRGDPLHTPFVENSREGKWLGNAGTENFAAGDSLGVEINDIDGVSAANVRIHWRVGSGTPPTFGAWNNKVMRYSDPNPTSPSDEGTYRTMIGNTTTEDYSANEAGSVPGWAGDPIWNGGQTVEYYVKVLDNGTPANTVVWPDTADDTPTPQYFRVQILPQGRLAGTRKILLVDDYTRNNLDFKNSTGFNPTGGAGFGDFTDPVFDQSEDMVERALILMYGGSEDLIDGVYGSPKWDLYNVQGAGSSQQREPRVIGASSRGCFGICSDLGAPLYDAVVWLQGSFDAGSLADTTRIELKTFLDSGGHLFLTGDEIGEYLGTGGSNADSTIQFLGDYLGISFPASADAETADRVLNVVGNGGTSLAGITVGLYGDCPGIRHAFDKLTEAPDVPGTKVSTTLATYQAGDGATNNRASIIKNVRVGGNGVAVTTGFAIESLVNDMARGCIMNKVFTVDFGLPATSFPGCINSGSDAPVVANGRFGFELAQASPNPFSEDTSIRFSVPSRTHVSVEIFNILGQKVRTLVNETLEGNSYVRVWDGRADGGAAVSSGIYFYKMVAGDYSATRKAVMLK